MFRRSPHAPLTRSRAYIAAAATVAALLLIQMITTVVGAVLANRQFESVAIDTFEYVGALTAERVSRFAESAVDVVEATARELEIKGEGMARDDLELSLYQRLSREDSVRAVYVGWPDGEFLVLRRDGDGYMSLSGGTAPDSGLTTLTRNADFEVTSERTDSTEYDPRERPWYLSGSTSHATRWTPPYLEFGTGRTLVSASRAARPDSNMTAVVGADLNLRELADVLDNLPYGEGAEAFVLTQQLQVVAAPSSYQARIEEVEVTASRVPRAADLGLAVDPNLVAPGTARFSQMDGMVVLDRGLPVEQTLPWRLHLTASDAQLSAGLGTLSTVMLGITVFSLAVVTVGVIVMWRLRRPLDRMRERAMTDPLTGLLNRHEFYRRARVAAQKAFERGNVVMIAVLDLDEFKSLNDRDGHVAGDNALIAVADGISGAVRTGDLVARIGGDEFAVLHVVQPADDPTHLAQRVRDGAEQSMHAAVDSSHHVGVTLGYALGGTTLTDLDVLVAHADNALITGKRAEKGRIYAAQLSASEMDRRRASPNSSES